MRSGRPLALTVALVSAMVSWGPAAAPAVHEHSAEAAPGVPADLSGGLSEPNLLDRRPPLAPSLQIRDSNGQFVGVVVNLYPEGAQVARRNGNDLLIFRVQRSGIDDSSSVQFVYESGDCSGPALMIDEFAVGDAGLAIQLPYKLGTSGYYPVPPYTTRPLSSVLSFPSPEAVCTSSGGIFHPPDQCCNRLEGFSFSVGAVRTVDFSSLEGPFHVEEP